MSHTLVRSRFQDATLWTVTGMDRFGADSVSAPMAIKVRWEDRNELFINPLNQAEETSRAVVYLDRRLRIGDWLFNGISQAPHPKDVAGALKIRRFDQVPNRRNLLVQRKAFL